MEQHDLPDAVTADEERILDEATREIGSYGGLVGGWIGGGSTGEHGDQGGGRIGVRLVRSHRKRDVYEATTSTSSADEGLARAEQVLEAFAGHVERLPEDRAGAIGLRAVVGAGYRKTNPALVTVRVALSGEITVRGVAKEGFLKQHAGRNAARRVLAELA